MASRDPKTLHPELAKRWALAEAAYRDKYPPPLPQVFITAALRGNEEQDKLYAQGRTAPGQIVTNARGGQSLHNYGLAFDVAFKTKTGSVDWSPIHFQRFAEIAKSFGLAWGGDWRRSKDFPHFEPPHFSWQSAAAGMKPVFPPLPPSVASDVSPSAGQTHREP